MIYLITGVPGSGKSLYAVSTLLKKLLSEKVVHEDGTTIERRLCIDGIPDLLLPHELLAKRPEGELRKVPNGPVVDAPAGEGNGLWNWFEWCKPGDVIVADEVQRHWRPRGMGVKPPAEISMLETHRHFGVDFVLITQNAMLLDQNVRRLVGRHLHVRRVFGGARAIVYDWDGCQTDTTRTAGAVRSIWSYPKSAYKLYKSSELHTKQHQKIPLWMAFPVVVLGLAVFVGPKAYSALSGSMTGKGIPGAAAGVSKAGVPAPLLPVAAAPGASAAGPGAGVVPGVAVVAGQAPPLVFGCIAMGANASMVLRIGLTSSLNRAQRGRIVSALW
jgi:zona occludens toxin